MTAEDRIHLIKMILREHECGDSSCIYGRPSGQMTNGGCSIGRREKDELRRELQRLVFQIRDALDGTSDGLGAPKEDAKKKDLPEEDRFATLEIE